MTIGWALAALLLLLCGQAQAQQGGTLAPPKLLAPQQGGESVLELPRSTRQSGNTQNLPSLAPQPGSTQNLPSLAPQPGQQLEVPMRHLRGQAGYAQVTVTVTTTGGGYLTGLRKDDFKLYVNGEPRPIEFFRQDANTPVSVGIIVDTSGSMTPKMRQARAAIAQFLYNLNQKDDIFLFAFSDRPFLLQGFTMNHSLVMARLGLLHAFGRTALYDAVLDGLLMVERGRYDKKALLVITDGMDNASSATLEQIVGQARRRGVLIYSIGIGDPNAPASSLGLALGPFALLGGGSDTERVDAQTLRTLSGETGAKTFVIAKVGEGNELRADCENISRELRQQYTLGFLAAHPEGGGYRSVRVEVPTHPEAGVRVRKGVSVGGPTEYASDPSSIP